VVVEDGRIVEARNACPLGIEWFGDGRVPTVARVGGRDTSVQEALAEASSLAAGAARALVYLAPGVSCEAQRLGGAIADVLHGLLDSVTSATALPALLAAQERGYASATLGEVRNRADAVVFWGVDVSERYPRFTSRYAPDPAGLHVPDGRRSRTVVAVDVGDERGPPDADRRIPIETGDEVAVLAALRALVSPVPGDGDYSACTGGAWDRARELAPVLLGGSYVALVYDAEADGAADHRDVTDHPGVTEHRSPLRFDALAALAQALNAHTRCAAVALRGGGNRSGADSVLTAQVGYPVAIDFSRGYPGYRPYDMAAPGCLTRGDVDAAVVLGAPSLVPRDVAAALARVPCAVIGPAASESSLGSARAVVDTGVAGIHGGGTALRTDDVPLPLRPPLAGPPDAADVALELLRMVREHMRHPRSRSVL
jgi:formylmethanofuran dehydrogenase subunit B